MAEITFTPITWADNGVPDIDAANLNPKETAIDQLAHKATRNAAGFELASDTAPDYGIGTSTPVAAGSGTAIDTRIKGGNFYCTNPVGLTAGTYSLTVCPLTALVCVQRVKLYTGGHPYERYTTDGGATWSAWTGYDADTVSGYGITGAGKKVWLTSSATAGDDGNGGQPPAPKPTAGTPAGGANTQGQLIGGSVASTGQMYYAGNLSAASGKWMCFAINVNASGAVNVATPPQIACATNGTWFVVPTGYTCYFWAWRVE